MRFYDNNHKPLTKVEIEKLKQKPEYREKINSDLKEIDNNISKLVLDRNKSDKIIGLVIGTEISCVLTLIADMTGLTEPNPRYSTIRIILLASSILIRNINLKNNHNRDKKIDSLNMIKEDIISENDWLNEQNYHQNNQKTLNY